VNLLKVLRGRCGSGTLTAALREKQDAPHICGLHKPASGADETVMIPQTSLREEKQAAPRICGLHKPALGADETVLIPQTSLREEKQAAPA